MSPAEFLARLAASRLAFWVSVAGALICLAGWGTWLQAAGAMITCAGLFLQWRSWVR